MKRVTALGSRTPHAELARWLTPEEVTATRRRIELLLEHKVHPYPPTDWPAVPWPPI